MLKLTTCHWFDGQANPPREDPARFSSGYAKTVVLGCFQRWGVIVGSSGDQVSIHRADCKFRYSKAYSQV
jgi:hypothetical protein